MKRVLILGANGFLGQHLSRFILKSYDNVELTLFSKTISPELENLKKIKPVTIVKGDYTDILELVPLVKNSDLVYHLISASVPSTSWVQPTLEINKNLLPTINLLRLCSDLGVEKFIYASSGGAVYGRNKAPVDEETKVLPFSPYGIVKATTEYFLEYFREKSGLNYDVYRISNPYGTGLKKIGFGVINTWLRAAQVNRPVRIFGDGTAAKDYIYVEDAVRMIAKSLEMPTDRSEIFNVCSGESTSLKKILETIIQVTGKDLEIIYEPSPKSDNKTVVLKNEKILAQFSGFQFSSLETGIRKIWEEMLNAKS